MQGLKSEFCRPFLQRWCTSEFPTGRRLGWRKREYESPPWPAGSRSGRSATWLTSCRKQCQCKMARRTPGQLSLPLPRTWGGRRRGAGRKATSRRLGRRARIAPAHNLATRFTSRFERPTGSPSIRSPPTFSAICNAIAAANDRRFRVAHFSAQTDHVHLIVEASSRERLSRGLQGLAGRLARAVNRAWRRSGDVWSGRYHAHDLATPTEVRNALVYVLLNSENIFALRRLSTRAARGPGSKAGRARPNRATSIYCPVAAPRTWLATMGWRRAGGPIDAAEGCPRDACFFTRRRR